MYFCGMVEIEGKILSRELFKQQFVCDLTKCKGACCVEGDAGAPLEEEEADFLKGNLEKIKPYLREEGLRAIEEQGVAVRDGDGDLVTPLVNGKECAFVDFDESGTALCGIELAQQDGVIDFKKPISCHLYPIRTRYFEESELEAINYHQWHICSPACDLGAQLQVKVYQFLKEPIIRKYGKEFFLQLEIFDKELNSPAE